MQLTLLLTTAFTLTTATLTAADTPPENNKWAQLRLFGSPGCDADNLLEMGVYGYQKNQCQSISQFGPIEAVNISSIFDECECKSEFFWIELTACLAVMMICHCEL